MPDRDAVANHYASGGLLQAIAAGVEKLGKTPQTVSIEDLGPVDEFHVGGRAATEHLLDQIAPAAGEHLLDVGCGLGGASRFAAQKYGVRVTGVDLTTEFIETGRELCTWVGLAGQVTLEQGDATSLAHADAAFDKAYMIHVGMNIADKLALTRELHRVVKPGGSLAIYDVMQTGDGDLTYPVPWASDAAHSAIGTPDDYKNALETAGFRIKAEQNRRDSSLDFFARQRAAADGPPPLGLHLVMGANTPAKIGNLVENIMAGHIAPVELIAQRST